MKYKGWIRLHRKIMEGSDWLAEPFTRAQAWIDLLLLANHKTGHIRKRGIMIEVERGQVGFSEAALAERWQWSRGKVRRFLKDMADREQISRIPAKARQSRFSPKSGKIFKNSVQQNPRLSNLISITNYDYYQESGTTGGTTNGTTNGTGTKNDKNDKNKTPDLFSLKNMYPNPDLIDQVFRAIASTRKYGKVSDSILHKQIIKWEEYPAEQVEAGIQIYLDKEYAGQGKREEYLMGIIRNQNGDKSQHQQHQVPNSPKQQPTMEELFSND